MFRSKMENGGVDWLRHKSGLGSLLGIILLYIIICKFEGKKMFNFPEKKEDKS